MTQPKTEIDLDQLEHREGMRVEGVADAILLVTRTEMDALIRRLRTVEDRLGVLDDPGTPTAILNGMFDAAETLGHPRYSSSHALGFLLDLIAAQQGELAEWRDLYPGETPDQAAEHYVA